VDVYVPAPTPVVIADPSAPSVIDNSATQGDAHYVLPANTTQVSWVLNADGSVTATAATGFVFSDGTTSKTFASPVDVYVPAPGTGNIPGTGNGGIAPGNGHIPGTGNSTGNGGIAPGNGHIPGTGNSKGHDVIGIADLIVTQHKSSHRNHAAATPAPKGNLPKEATAPTTKARVELVTAATTPQLPNTGGPAVWTVVLAAAVALFGIGVTLRLGRNN